MKITKREDAIHLQKSKGNEVWYYLFDEYEIHYNCQGSQTTQTWHRHKKFWETIIILSGELTASWKEGTKTETQIVKNGDVIEIENTLHSFVNHTDEATEFIVFKQVLSGQNKREIFKNDKIIE